MKAIVAMDKNRVIGLDGTIPWHIPEDLKWFKELTYGKTLVVGKTTFYNLPKLKNRTILFISRPKQHGDTYYIVNSVGEYVNKQGLVGYRFLNYTDIVYKNDSEDFIVAGGAKIYKVFLPYITEFYVTHINDEYEGDTYMPPFEHLFKNNEIIKQFDKHIVVKYSNRYENTN